MEVAGWVGDRLGDLGEAGAMEHGLDAFVTQRALEEITVAEVADDQLCLCWYCRSMPAEQ